MNLKLTQLFQNSFARSPLLKREKFKMNILWVKIDNREHLGSSPLQTMLSK